MESDLEKWYRQHKEELEKQKLFLKNLMIWLFTIFSVKNGIFYVIIMVRYHGPYKILYSSIFLYASIFFWYMQRRVVLAKRNNNDDI